jgi:uncharacterized phiE125 gp8 family phage protein
MSYALELKTAPTHEPITLEEAKDHLRVDGTDDDALISDLITAARKRAEKFQRRAFITQTWTVFLDEFPVWIRLPKPPLQSVTSVKYLDTDGVQQTLASADYRVDTKSVPARITPAWNESWPSTRAVTNAVEIEMVVGYGAATVVPEEARAAIKIYLGGLYENREPTKEEMDSVEALLWPDRVLEFA